MVIQNGEDQTMIWREKPTKLGLPEDGAFVLTLFIIWKLSSHKEVRFW